MLQNTNAQQIQAYEEEWEAYEKKIVDMYASVDKYVKNVKAISVEDRHGKYQHALQKLFEKCFRLVRWYVIDQSGVSNLYIEADENGNKCFKELSEEVLKIDDAIEDYLTDGSKPKLEAIIASLFDRCFPIWNTYQLSSKPKIKKPLKTDVYLQELTKRQVPTARF